jgi:hypothetical protein
MREREFREEERNRREPDREARLLELLRSVRPPEPSPEYLAAFWPRLKGKLRPRRLAILHPLYYGGLAAAAAALVLWVSLTGPDTAGMVRSVPPVYTLATASSPAGKGPPAISYISGTPRRTGPGVHYVLPRSGVLDTRRLEV